MGPMTKRRRRLGAVAGFAVGVLTITPDVALADCPAQIDALRASIATNAAAAIFERFEAIFDDAACTDAERAQAGRLTALSHVSLAVAAQKAGASLAEQRPLLEKSLEARRLWQAVAMLADLERKDKNYADAALLYEEALNRINDPRETPRAPSHSAIERIIRLTAETKLLADRFVEHPLTRDGSIGGLASPLVRGFGVVSVPAPITFVVNTATFTADGKQAADETLRWLRQQKPPQITIVGHTDPRGEDAYNLDLSKQRAQAVADFLSEGRFRGRVAVVGKGESQRFEPVDPTAYSQEERWQLDRRVEIIRE